MSNFTGQERIITGKYYRVWDDKAGLWRRYSFVTDSGDVMMPGTGTLKDAINNNFRGNGSLSFGRNTFNAPENIRTFVLGTSCEAKADNAYAGGCKTTSGNFASYAIGKLNTSMSSGGSETNQEGAAFVVGNGIQTSSSAITRSNAMSVTYKGVVKAASTITASTTADYAELFEWKDGNPTNEDRVGRFVTLDGDMIRLASSEDDYILGIVSGRPFVLGNGDCDSWTSMYLTDKFNRYLEEPAEKLEPLLDNDGNYIYDDNGQLLTQVCTDANGNVIYEGTRLVLNPLYDPDKVYISRLDRPEWSPIGMLGVLTVIDDGSCEVNGYATVNNDGYATKATPTSINKYRVISRIDESTVKVVFR